MKNLTLLFFFVLLFGCSSQKQIENQASFTFNKQEYNCEGIEPYSGELETFASVKYGFKIDVPKGWLIEENEYKDDNTYSFYCQKPTKRTDDIVAINVAIWKDTTSLEKVFKNELFKVKTKFEGDFFDIGTYEYSSNKFTWTYSLLNFENVDESIQYLSFYIKKDNQNFYSINFSSSNEKNALMDLCSIIHIISTFRLTITQ